MAAPRKSGLDYFALDCDFFSDRKIKILKSRYGADGITLYVYLLCEIYRQGYYIKIDNDFFFIVADDLNMGDDKVRQVLTFLLERAMFDNNLFQSDAVLTSTGIQRRYQEAVKTRALKNSIVVGKYWLLSENETKPYIKHTLNGSNSEKNGSNSEKNGSNSEKNSTKESKVKESKVKESKVEKSKVDNKTGSVFSTFEECGFMITQYAAEELTALSDEYSPEWVIEAIKRAADRGKKNMAYIRGILNNWGNAGSMDSPEGKSNKRTAECIDRGALQEKFHMTEVENKDFGKTVAKYVDYVEKGMLTPRELREIINHNSSTSDKGRK